MSRTLVATPAIAGGRPVRERFLPVAAPRISEAAIAEVVDTLRSGWLATGPKTADFERRFADYVGTAHAIGLTSGTAALALALELCEVGPGDEVISSPLTFVASAHEIVRRGATPVFAEIDGQTLNLDPGDVARRITPRTRAILLVHFAGRPCPMKRFAALARDRGVPLLSDSAHSIEARADGRRLAEWFPLSAYSFHPVKNLTTGEGGMLVTDREEWAERARRLRLHGVTRDAWRREAAPSPSAYDVVELGQKCNMSDVQASLGLHQLAELEAGLAHRERLWAAYDRGLAEMPALTPPAAVARGDRHARHLYTVQLELESLRADRATIVRALHAENVGAGHHYPAIHRLTFYRERLAPGPDALRVASRAAERLVTLPLHARMNEADVADVVLALARLLEFYR